MKGWLVVNGFLKRAKFNELYGFFQNSAHKLNIDLQVVESSSLVCEACDGFTCDKPDFVLFWDKDVCLARRMERAGFRLFNSAQAVETCDSKTLTAMKLAGIVPMPKTVFSPKTFQGVGYPDLTFVTEAAQILGLPMVIKESYGSFGEQVYLAKTLQEAQLIATKLAGKDFVMQSFVSESCGRDVRINVVGGKYVNAILRQSDVDFRSNATLGGKVSPFVPSAEQIAVAEKACQTIGLDFAGVDVMFGNDGPVLCEVNSNPHFKTTFDCTGLDISTVILQHVSDVLQKRSK